MNVHARRGSALLITLGMLGFMMISAVGFCVFMRQNRVPSSFARANVASRHLVKAALARAIEEIDLAVGNHQFPGVAPSGATFGPAGNPDVWIGGVHCPFGRLVDPTTTAATLTLEGLGYVPAPLLNEVRYYSRRSTNAVPRTLGYGMGSYAFTAVNVSDCFDVNEMRAYTNRSSACPIGLAPLFLTEDCEEVDVTLARNFDDFVHRSRGGEYDRVPFTSLLDFNLALSAAGGNLAAAGIRPYFGDWITGKNRMSVIYGEDYRRREDKSAYAKVTNRLQRLMFVCDSWIPNTNAVSVAKGGMPVRTSPCDLSDPRWQPFQGFPTQRDRIDLKDIVDMSVNKCPFINKFANPEFMDANVIQLPELVALYDYLDDDSVPISLAMPCTERVPMVVAAEVLENRMSWRVKGKVEKKVTDPETGETLAKTLSFRLVPDGTLSLNLGMAFPFKRDLGRSGKFTAEIIGRIFFTSVPDGRCRASAARETGLGPTDFVTVPKKVGAGTARLDPETKSSLLFYGTSARFSVPADVKANDDVYFDLADVAGPIDVRVAPDELEILKDVQLNWKTKTAVAGPNGKVGAPGEFHLITGAKGKEWEPVEKDQDLDAGEVFRPSIAVWARITNEDGKTVDLVPARIPDDDLYNGRKNAKSEVHSGDSKLNEPFLRFSAKLGLLGGDGVSLDGQKLYAAIREKDDDKKDLILSDAKPLELNENALLTGDPRFNYAPENFYPVKIDGDMSPGDLWTESESGVCDGGDMRQRDLFLFVSNQGYLQSIDELAFLPYLNQFGKMPRTDLYPYDLTVYAGERPANRGALKDASRMWTVHAWEGEFLTMLSAQCSLAPPANSANPYSGSAHSLAAAFLYLPFDWWAAGTNVHLSAGVEKEKLQQVEKPLTEGLKYTFSSKSQDPGSQIKNAKMLEIANAFTARMRSGMSYDEIWNEEFARAESDGDTSLFGVQLDRSTPMHEIDKKFLYSYLRRCFDVRQQLFLVFVRANATSGAGDPGTRAVALVWRDPAPPRTIANPNQNRNAVYYSSMVHQPNWRSMLYRDADAPHRTRILHYHQFD